MLAVTDVQFQCLDELEVCSVFKALVEAVAVQNEILIRKLGLPPLYKSGVRFQNEPWAGKLEEVASALTVLRRGWGDCDDLNAYLIGEYRAQGIPATCKVYVREHLRASGRKLRLYHVETRLPDGSVDDPSRLLGM